MVNLSMEHGNSAASCVGYVLIGRVLAEDFGNYPAALRFGQLSLNLVDERGLDAVQGPRLSDLRDTASATSHNIFDLVGRSCYRPPRKQTKSATSLNWLLPRSYHRQLHGLRGTSSRSENGRQWTASTSRGRLVLGFLRLSYSVTSARFGILRGLPHDFGSFDDEAFDEDDFQRRFEAGQNRSLTACSYWIRKLQECAFMGDYAGALEASAKAQAFPWIIPPIVEMADYHLYTALALAGSADTVAAVRRDQEMAHLESLAVHHRQLQAWASNALRISRTVPHWSARRSRVWKAASSTPNACTSRRSDRPAPTASSTTKRSPTKRRRASTWRAALITSPSCIS